MFEKLAPHTLRGRIAQKVREAILNGSLQAGERIVERKLATALGASLTAVREALIELESEGFILKKTNLGTYVTKMGLEDVEKVFQVRRVLEAYAIGEAASHGTPDQVDKLERTYLQMVDAARGKDARAFNQQDMYWHLLAWEMSGNEYLQAALRRAVLPYLAFTAIRIAAVDPLGLLRDANQHLAILEAIKAKDADGAQHTFISTLDSWLAITRSEFARASELQLEASDQAPALV